MQKVSRNTAPVKPAPDIGLSGRTPFYALSVNCLYIGLGRVVRIRQAIY